MLTFFPKYFKLVLSKHQNEYYYRNFENNDEF